LAPPNGKTNGKIVLAKGFDQYVGTGGKAYLDIGADKGLKPGDYMRVTRTYHEMLKNEGDNPSFHASAMEDTQKNPNMFPNSRLRERPRRPLGEMVAWGVYPPSAPGMLVASISDVSRGDAVELMDGPLPPPPPPPPPMNPPVITCSASPSTVRRGESSSIQC